jgi:hypothetical protein
LSRLVRKRTPRSSTDVVIIERAAAVVRRVVDLTRGTIHNHRNRYEQVVRGTYLGAQTEVVVNAFDGSVKICVHRAAGDGMLVLGCDFDFPQQVEVIPGVFRLINDSGAGQRSWAALSDIVREDLCELLSKTGGYVKWNGSRIEFSQPEQVVLREDANTLITHLLELGAIMATIALPGLM